MNDSIKIIQNKVQDNLRKAMSDESLILHNQANKQDYMDRSKKGVGDAHWRLVASYPIEVRTLLVNKYGAGALKDEVFYKQFLKSEEMDLFRAVPKTEI
jgi:hypothetical protein